MDQHQIPDGGVNWLSRMTDLPPAAADEMIDMTLQWLVAVDRGMHRRTKKKILQDLIHFAELLDFLPDVLAVVDRQGVICGSIGNT